MEELCRAFEEAMATGEIDPLLLIPMFILDFLCIHPFNDGNGRMSRLLTLLLLYRSGYIVGKYIKTGANRRDYKKHSGNNYKKGNRRKVSGYQCGNDTENTGRITDSRKNFKNRRRKVYEIYLE